MLILLPPSEGKTAPRSGSPLDWDLLSATELNPARRRIADELVEVSRWPEAATILGVGERMLGEIEAQRELYRLPTARAREVYTGVLYEAACLTADDETSVLIFSGLFGVTAASDPIPAYRLSMGVKLPDAGSLKAFWREQLRDFDPGTSATSTCVRARIRCGTRRPPGGMCACSIRAAGSSRTWPSTTAACSRGRSWIPVVTMSPMWRVAWATSPSRRTRTAAT